MPGIKPIEQSSDKWSRRSMVAGPDYQAGVQNPRKPWQASALAQEGAWKEGVTRAVQQSRFAKGIRKVTEDFWKSWTLRKGPNRYVEGVGLAKGMWQAGFRPYQQAIAGLNLPARGPRGDIRNLERVKAIATTLRQVYESMSSSS